MILDSGLLFWATLYNVIVSTKFAAYNANDVNCIQFLNNILDWNLYKKCLIGLSISSLFHVFIWRDHIYTNLFDYQSTVIDTTSQITPHI